jgi:membrane-associated phospholipid phosphatase
MAGSILKTLLWSVVVLLVATSASAQEVRRLPDAVSWGTAAVNPTMAVVQALRSDTPTCRLLQLAISESVGNGLTLTLKHFIRSPRPCVGCPPDGFPSGHTMNATIGLSWNVRLGSGFAGGTGALRIAARRHTPWQVAGGLGLGLLAEGIGHLKHCE